MVGGLKKFVLSLDGGGIRGIIPAKVLMEVEEKSGKPIHEMFDLVGGASTGAILAAGLCLKDETGQRKFTPQDILHIYENNGPEIFARSYRHWTHYFYGSKYSEAPLEGVFESHFANSRLQDTLTRLMIPAFNITQDKPSFFKSWLTQHHSLLIKDILRGATAAPTYFKPKEMKIPTRTGEGFEDVLLYDGAVSGNNLSACVYADALNVFPNDEIHVLSIGTGDRQISFGAKNPGAFQFSKILVPLMFSASEESVDYQMRRFAQDRYTRIQLTKDMEDMYTLDDASPSAIKGLKEDAEKVIKKHADDIGRFIETYRKSKIGTN